MYRHHNRHHYRYRTAAQRRPKHSRNGCPAAPTSAAGGPDGVDPATAFIGWRSSSCPTQAMYGVCINVLGKMTRWFEKFLWPPLLLPPSAKQNCYLTTHIYIMQRGRFGRIQGQSSLIVCPFFLMILPKRRPCVSGEGKSRVMTS